VNSAENTRHGRGIQYGCPRYTRQTRSIVIVLNILCDSGHRFEGWFASTDAFRSQCERQLVNCPHCQTSDVRLLPSAPHVRRASVHHPSNPRRSRRQFPPDAAGKLFQALALAAKLAKTWVSAFPRKRAGFTTRRRPPAASVAGRVPKKPWPCLRKASWCCRPPFRTRTSFTDAACGRASGLRPAQIFLPAPQSPSDMTSPAAHASGWLWPAFAAFLATRIWPPRASLHRRAARLVTLPIAP
jgi:hypothetical protein